MGLEIERKFLLVNSQWRKEVDTQIEIKQGYLNSHIERTVRIRLYGEKGVITVKGKNKNATRQEFEYEIPHEEALELLKLCEQPIIEKVRFEIIRHGKLWEIDEFEGNNKGLIVAEIELESEEEEILFPDWIGKEVTQEAKYFNSSLISNPFEDWE